MDDQDDFDDDQDDQALFNQAEADAETDAEYAAQEDAYRAEVDYDEYDEYDGDEIDITEDEFYEDDIPF